MSRTAAARLSSRRPPQTGEPTSSVPGFNDAESPLAWLRARRGKQGMPLISDAQFLAGERLRRDFERAMLARRTTTNWDLAGAGSPSGFPAEPDDAALAARERHHRALRDVGPELSGILTEVCCLAAGIEQAERALDLPQRSGKAVLGLALTALARHYGLLALGQAGGSGIRRWGAAGYRPVVPPVASSPDA